MQQPETGSVLFQHGKPGPDLIKFSVAKQSHSKRLWDISRCLTYRWRQVGPNIQIRNVRPAHHPEPRRRTNSNINCLDHKNRIIFAMSDMPLVWNTCPVEYSSEQFTAFKRPVVGFIKQQLLPRLLFDRACPVE